MSKFSVQQGEGKNAQWKYREHDWMSETHTHRPSNIIKYACRKSVTSKYVI